MSSTRKIRSSLSASTRLPLQSTPQKNVGPPSILKKPSTPSPVKNHGLQWGITERKLFRKGSNEDRPIIEVVKRFDAPEAMEVDKPWSSSRKGKENTKWVIKDVRDLKYQELAFPVPARLSLLVYIAVDTHLRGDAGPLRIYPDYQAVVPYNENRQPMYDWVHHRIFTGLLELQNQGKPEKDANVIRKWIARFAVRWIRDQFQLSDLMTPPVSATFAEVWGV